jgi:ABC-type branched-subunit amino acid transport system substrate-binding protein
MANTFYTLQGFGTLLNFLNAHGGINGRTFEFSTLEMDDTIVDFSANLDSLIRGTNPHLVVGGSCQNFASETAKYFQRTGKPWFGPWTNSPEIFSNRSDDPVGILPTNLIEFALLFDWAKTRLAPDKFLYFIIDSGPTAEKTSALARAQARRVGLEIKIISLPTGFRQWNNLAPLLENPGGIILWTATGPAAAIRRTLANTISPGVFWMTHSLNTPSLELLTVTAGAWKDTIFPAVLIPSDEIPETYITVFSKYAPYGLNQNYQSYLGFSQGQLMSRALAGLSNGRPSSQELLTSLRQVSTQGTLFAGERLPQNALDPGGTYLARAGTKGNWLKIITQP